MCKLKKQIVERILAVELEHDLGYSKHSKLPKADNNRRNGSYEKTIIDENGSQIRVAVPRDREGGFVPQLLPKGVRRFNGFDDKVISLYARGMSHNCRKLKNSHNFNCTNQDLILQTL